MEICFTVFKVFYFVDGQVVRENVGGHYANVLLRDVQI